MHFFFCFFKFSISLDKRARSLASGPRLKSQLVPEKHSTMLYLEAMLTMLIMMGGPVPSCRPQPSLLLLLLLPPPLVSHRLVSEEHS